MFFLLNRKTLFSLKREFSHLNIWEFISPISPTVFLMNGALLDRGKANIISNRKLNFYQLGENRDCNPQKSFQEFALFFFFIMITIFNLRSLLLLNIYEYNAVFLTIGTILDSKSLELTDLMQ